MCLSTSQYMFLNLLQPKPFWCPKYRLVMLELPFIICRLNLVMSDLVCCVFFSLLGMYYKCMVTSIFCQIWSNYPFEDLQHNASRFGPKDEQVKVVYVKYMYHIMLTTYVNIIRTCTYWNEPPFLSFSP